MMENEIPVVLETFLALAPKHKMRRLTTTTKQTRKRSFPRPQSAQRRK
jgi:hypothetical protein